MCGSNSTLSPPTVKRFGKAEPRREEARVIWGCQIVPPDHTQCRNPKNVSAGEDTVGVRIVKQCAVLVLAGYELVADRPNPTGIVDIRTQMPCRILARHAMEFLLLAQHT